MVALGKRSALPAARSSAFRTPRCGKSDRDVIDSIGFVDHINHGGEFDEVARLGIDFFARAIVCHFNFDVRFLRLHLEQRFALPPSRL